MDVFRVAQPQLKGHAVFGDFNVAREQIRLRRNAVGHMRNRHVAQQLRRPLVIGVNGGIFRHAGGEERLFALEVVLHRAEIVQMVLAEVSVAAALERHAVQPVHIQRVRRHLHDDHLHACLHHLVQVAHEVNRIGRGLAGRDVLLADHVARRADQPALEARLFADRLDHVAGRRLALRAGDAHEAHFPLRMIKERLADSRHCRAAIAHQHLRHVHIVQEAFHYQCHAAILHRLRGILMRIKMCAGKAEEDAVFGLFPAVGTQRRNLHGHIAPGFQQVRHFLDKLSQFHRQLAPLFVIPGHQQKNRCAGLYIFSRCRALLYAQPLPRHGHH